MGFRLWCGRGGLAASEGIPAVNPLAYRDFGSPESPRSYMVILKVESGDAKLSSCLKSRPGRQSRYRSPQTPEDVETRKMYAPRADARIDGGRRVAW
jgi:hypothetical protein